MRSAIKLILLALLSTSLLAEQDSLDLIKECDYAFLLKTQPDKVGFKFEVIEIYKGELDGHAAKVIKDYEALIDAIGDHYLFIIKRGVLDESGQESAIMLVDRRQRITLEIDGKDRSFKLQDLVALMQKEG